MKTVLVIDDDPQILDMMREILAPAGYDVVVATSGRDGIRMFRDHRPDVVVTDIVMPNMDGLETAREIRALDPRAKIIAISGALAVGPDFLKIAEKLGAAASLRKPFRRNDLLASLSRVLTPTAPRTAEAG